jgi:hypothetical protein
MKKKENIKKTEVGSRKTEVKKGQRAESREPEMWLKPDFGCNSSIRQLKLTAKDSEKSNFSAVSFAVEFIQRQLKLTAKDSEKSNLSAVSFAPEKSGQAAEFIQCQLKLTAKDSEKSNLSAVSFAVEFIQRIRKYNVTIGLQPKKRNIEYRISNNNLTVHQFDNLTNKISTVCFLTPLNPLKGSARTHKEMVAGFVRGISPLGVRGSAGFEITTNKISTVFNIKKPSATETRFPAEGCISGSRAIRACLLIRVFNN